MTTTAIFTWIGRAWSLAFLLLVGLVAWAAFADWFRRRRDVRLVRRLASSIVDEPDPDFIARTRSLVVDELAQRRGAVSS